MWVGFDVRDNRRWTFSPEEALLRIMESYFSQEQWIEGKKHLYGIFFYTNTLLFTSQDVN